MVALVVTSTWDADVNHHIDSVRYVKMKICGACRGVSCKTLSKIKEERGD